MFKKSLLSLCFIALAASLPGCTSIEAAASGPGPIGVKPGERTLSMKIEDRSIENTIEVNITKADPAFSDANVTVVSFYGSVLLAGQVPTQALKDKAETVAHSVEEVKKVHNMLSVGEASYYGSRVKDSYISTRISSAMTFSKDFPSSRCTFTTVNNVVYLMGKLTHDEASQAVQLISDISGVQKIVKLVDYLPDVDNNVANSAPAPAAASGQ
jgi:osmotically-inducible protein OsmY